jgi:hypothetical protein
MTIDPVVTIVFEEESYMVVFAKYL